jgi:multicomponent Na+:H+ antiporter subunit D
MLPVLPVVLPLFAAALLAALTKLIPQWLSQVLAVAATLATLAINIYLLHASTAQPIVYWFGGWRPRHGIALGISFSVDPVGAGLATFVSILMLAAFVFSSKYFDTVGNHFHALLLAFLAAMCGFCLTGDMFNMFVFFELMSAAAFALCGYKTEDPGSLQGAFNFAVTNTIGAYFVLSGIGLLYARTGALNMAQMGRALSSGPLDSLVLVGFVFVVCGYLIKAAVVPFHFWLADAHAVAPTPVCILFSGVMVEMGLFALARIYWDVFDHALHPHLNGLRTLFVSIGVVTAFVGAFMCYLQRNLKRLLAFSTISHVGLMTVGVGLFTPEGLAGAAVYTLGHGMVKAALFLVAGILLHRFETVDECDLHAKGLRERWTAAVFISGGVALAGLPFSGLAAGDDLMHVSATDAGFGWIRWISLFAGAVTSAAVLRAGAGIFFGWGSALDRGSAPKQEEKPETKQGHDHTPVTMFIPAAVLVTAGILLGLVPHLKPAASTAATQFENANAYAAHVLDNQPAPVPVPAPSVPGEISTGLLAVLAAMAIAATHLFSPRIRSVFSVLAKPLRLLHQVHSGHVGDYVAFLTFGMACYGLLCAYCFR